MILRSRTLGLCVVSLFFALPAVEGWSAVDLAAPPLQVSLAMGPSPARTGTTIQFTAEVTGGDGGAIEYAFWLFDRGAWHGPQPYGPTRTFSWTPALPGTAAVQVWIRRVGSTEAFEHWTGTGLFEVGAAQPVEPVRLVSLAANTTLPPAAGTTMTWTANGTGGDVPLEYQFWHFDASGWRMVQDFSPSPHYTWTPSSRDVGTHAIQVWVRRQQASIALEDWRGSGYFDILPAGPVHHVVLQATRPVPLEAGQSITWQAQAGRTDVEYQFWRFSRSAWAMVQDFGVGTSYTWTPGTSDVGSNAIQVWARAAGSSAALEAWTGTGLFEVLRASCAGLPHIESVCHQPVPSYLARDYLADLQVRTAADITSRRQALVSWIWGTDRLPDVESIPAGALEIGVRHPAIEGLDLPNLQRVDRYRIEVDVPAAGNETIAPLRSYVYEFVPVTSNHRLLVYNQGHIRDPALVFAPATMLGADTVLRVFLELGYTVLYIQMPLLGDNADPRFPVFGEANPHDLLGARRQSGYNPLKAFLHPIRAAIGYARSRQAFTEVSMTGVSGGGWATTVYAALDPGIAVSFPVAGSLPLSLNQGEDDPCRHGMDWEQAQFPAAPDGSGTGQPLGYLDLYVMASAPTSAFPSRRHIQILNRYDPCCFKGAKAEGTYGEQISSVASSLGGSYRLAVDATHAGHLVSECALRAFVLPALGHPEP